MNYLTLNGVQTSLQGYGPGGHAPIEGRSCSPFQALVFAVLPAYGPGVSWRQVCRHIYTLVHEQTLNLGTFGLPQDVLVFRSGNSIYLYINIAYFVHLKGQ